MVRDMNMMEMAEFIGRLKKNHDCHYDALALQLRQMAYRRNVLVLDIMV